MDKQNEKDMVDLLNQEMRELQAHQKQIEEMAKVIEEAMAKARRTLGGHNNIAMFYATMLSNAGYCKIPEGAVVLTREEYENLQALKGDYVKGYEAGVDEGWDNARKETAEKFAEMVSQAIVDNTYPYFDKDGKPVNIWKAVVGFDTIDEIAKEITEGNINAKDVE